MRSTPIGYAVSANPIAATLEKLFVGQRSGVRPVRASVFCQNQLKVLRWRVSRNAVSRGVIPVGWGNVGTGGLTGALHAAVNARTASNKLRNDQLLGIGFP